MSKASRRAMAVASFWLAATALAQPYPSRPIHIVVPFPAGSAGDMLARTIGPRLTEQWHQPVVVENRPGAGGGTGAASVAKAPADGYTLLMGTVSTHAINPSLYRSLPYDAAKDFAPVVLVASAANVLVVAPALPAASVRELIGLAKAQPGRLTFGSAGNGTTLHLSGELFKTLAAVDLVHVPYKGTPQALTDLVGGQISLMFSPLPSALPMVREGRLKPLAVTSAARSSQMPDLPTIAESGLPGFDAVAWNGIFVPSGTPRDIVAKLAEAIARIVNLPEVKEKFIAQGFEVAQSDPESFNRFIRTETEKWAKVVRESGARVD